MLKFIDLDFVSDCVGRNRMGRLCVTGEARSELKAHSLTSKVLEEHGPNGNAVVRLTGNRAAIVRYIENVYAPGDGKFYETFMRDCWKSNKS